MFSADILGAGVHGRNGVTVRLCVIRGELPQFGVFRIRPCGVRVCVCGPWCRPALWQKGMRSAPVVPPLWCESQERIRCAALPPLAPWATAMLRAPVKQSRSCRACAVRHTAQHRRQVFFYKLKLVFVQYRLPTKSG